MGERVSFNINAELYENRFGELAVRFPGEKVYRDVGEEKGASFVRDTRTVVVEKRYPRGWHEMPAHELLYGKGWHCISRLGFIDGDTERPGVEFEVDPGEIGDRARAYLKGVLH
jgi:hypothetical protein